jgi:hypothetical protein
MTIQIVSRATRVGASMKNSKTVSQIGKILSMLARCFQHQLLQLLCNFKIQGLVKTWHTRCITNFSGDAVVAAGSACAIKGGYDAAP